MENDVITVKETVLKYDKDLGEINLSTSDIKPEDLNGEEHTNE